MAWFVPSVLAAALAVLAHFALRHHGFGGGRSGGNVSDGSDSSVEQRNHPSSGSYFAIGDLHGDVTCARHWIARTGLIEGFRPDPPDRDDPKRWKWNEGVGSSLVFVGDYVDKGPTSRQTVEVVMTLTERFPDRVTAILGNHELELLRDRDATGGVGRWGGGGFHQLPYASAHPGEYLNYVDSPDETDELVVALLYNASAEVYGLGHHQFARVAPPPPGEHDMSSYYRTYGMVPITEYIDPVHRDLVAERLRVYQRAYLDAYRSETELGRWLEARPIIHLADDGTLFVHGGVSSDTASHLLALASSASSGSVLSVRAGVDRLNDLFRRHSQESNLTSFLDNTPTGQAIEELVTYRGNHPHSHFGGEGACSSTASVLESMGRSVRRLALGHTPDETVRISCDGTVLAVDSLLGRWIRAAGNDYCPGDTASEAQPPKSSNGRYVCAEVGEVCKGHIVRLDTDGKVKIIH